MKLCHLLGGSRRQCFLDATKFTFWMRVTSGEYITRGLDFVFYFERGSCDALYVITYRQVLSFSPVKHLTVAFLFLRFHEPFRELLAVQRKKSTLGSECQVAELSILQTWRSISGLVLDRAHVNEDSSQCFRAQGR